MKNVIYFSAASVFFILVSCQKQQKSPEDSKLSNDTVQFIGSWVQPNPINDKEIQGYKFNSDSTAQSINMATLKCHKWWIDSGKLVLVLESIGNRVSSIDTIKYDVILINEKELKIKSGEFVEEYKRK